MLQYSSIRAFLYPTSSRAKVIKINLASWHALFAKAHTLQLLRASIIRKCNKIRQTDYISKLRSKIKHNLGPPIRGVVLIERQPLCGIIVMPGHRCGLTGGVWHILAAYSHHSFTASVWHWSEYLALKRSLCLIQVCLIHVLLYLIWQTKLK